MAITSIAFYGVATHTWGWTPLRTAYFNLPTDRVVTLGTQVDLWRTAIIDGYARAPARGVAPT